MLESFIRRMLLHIENLVVLRMAELAIATVWTVLTFKEVVAETNGGLICSIIAIEDAVSTSIDALRHSRCRFVERATFTRVKAWS